MNNFIKKKTVSMGMSSSGKNRKHSELTDLLTSGHIAAIISYDPSTTFLVATNVQAALEELITELDISNVAYKNEANTFTKTQTIDQGGMVNSVLNINGSTDSRIRSTSTDLLQIQHGTTNSIEIDDSKNVWISTKRYKFEDSDQGTMELSQVTYDDIRIAATNFDRAGISDPSIISYQPSGSGRSFLLYEFANDDIAYATVQIPHTYKEGEDISVHVHWTPGPNGVTENGNTVAWKVDVSWVNINSISPSSTTYDMTGTCDGENYKSQMSFATMDLDGTGKKISSQLLVALYRDSTDTWTGTGAGDRPILIELDFHYPINTMGSRQEYIK